VQFRLQTLLLVFVVAWSSLAVFGMGGIVVFPFAVGLGICLSRAASITGLFAVLLVLMLLIALLLPAAQSARESARQAQCMNNLKQIALALLTYDQHYGCFPPAYIADKNGKPTHSWRVLILRLCGMLTPYKLNEPWDGPNNKRLLAACPSIYRCPSDENAQSPSATQTSYVAIVGANTAWSGEKSRHLKELAGKGGASHTIMVVEVANSGIHWAEPRDLSVESIAQAAAAAPNSVGFVKHVRRTDGFFFYHDTVVHGINVALADGSVRFLPAGALTAGNLRKLLQVGGYKEGDYDLDSWTEGQGGINWTNCSALVVWIASVGLLLYRARRSRKVRESHAETGNSTGSC
jgi:hypothetical protein